MTKPFQCNYCGRRIATERGMQYHTRDCHPGLDVAFKRYKVIRAADDEPSYADLTIEAQINKECGLPYEGWLLGE